MVVSMDKNIVLVVSDTLSAFHLPKYGYERNTAPFLTKIADENIHCKFGYSTGPWTVPAHGSLFTGMLPSENNINSQRMEFGDNSSFVEELNKKGYKTLGVSNNGLISESTGFGKGFDKLLSKEEIYFEHYDLGNLKEALRGERTEKYSGKKEKYLEFFRNSVYDKDIKSIFHGLKYFYRSKIKDKAGFPRKDSGARITNELVKKELKNIDEKFFLFINYMEPHQPYEPSREIVEEWGYDYDEVAKVYQKNLRGKDFLKVSLSERQQELIKVLYDAEIKYLDKKIEDLFKYIRTNFDDTLFIIVGGHGENIGDYELVDHQYAVWERLIRVPMIIAGNSVENRVIEKNVSIRELKALITGDKDVDDLGSDKVFAEYYGAKGFFIKYGNRDLDEFEGRERDLMLNESKCIVKGKTGLIKNSEIEDFGFIALEDSFSEESAELENQEKLCQILDEKFGNDEKLTEDIDF